MFNNWYPIATHEFSEVVKSRLVWLLTVPIVLDGLLNVLTSQTAIQHLGNLRYIASFQRGMGLVIPIACIILGARAVGGARGKGFLTNTALQPVSRGDVLVGKAAGRTSGLLVPLSTGLALGYIHGAMNGDIPPLLPTIGFWLANIVYLGSLMFAMIGLSAFFKEALAPAGFAFILGGGTFLFYDELLPIPLKAIYGVTKASPSTSGVSMTWEQPDAPLGLVAFLSRLPPTNAHQALTNWPLGLPNSDSLSIFVIRQLEPDFIAPSVVILGDAYGGQPVPFYLHPLVSGVVLLVFSTAVFALGYYTFNNTDFNQ
ncbi:hypothetical protein ELS19_10170 [Halogeometricum borinquense]|uniref:ABC transporter permease n=1 Tax=Halogeometricum borinquense TaxID=60847 RepID=A0A482TC36_9EURY|nr:ABC transporter permease subunit [Halogeometricum borinquense]RYJ14292.1 hypothetical protein ELS19_10170 [Halogeometricum borinquense]